MGSFPNFDSNCQHPVKGFLLVRRSHSPKKYPFSGFGSSPPSPPKKKPSMAEFLAADKSDQHTPRLTFTSSFHIFLKLSPSHCGLRFYEIPLTSFKVSVTRDLQASLNLKDGANEVTFSVTTKYQVNKW